MIIANGTIRPITETGGGYDESGSPIPASRVEGEEIPCNIQTDTHDRRGVSEDGTYSNHSYTILIDQQPWTARRIRLYDNRKNDIGEFQIQDEQFLDCVGAIKLKAVKP